MFSTKHRDPLITRAIQPRLYAYIGGIIREEGGSLYELGGMPDHVHLLIRWRADEALSNLMRRVKRNSSLWIHENFSEMDLFAWRSSPTPFGVGGVGGFVSGGCASLTPGYIPLPLRGKESNRSSTH